MDEQEEGGEPAWRPGRVADRVYDQLFRFIVDEDLRPGDRLPSEQQIGRMTAASRPIVREALTRLQAEGLLVSRRGAGSFLRRRPEVWRDHGGGAGGVLEFRTALEPAAAALAARRRDCRQIEAIKAALSASSGFQLHRAIAEASGNPLFLIAVGGWAGDPGRSEPARQTAGSAISPERLGDVDFEHLEIVHAITCGDAETAEAAMRHHLLRARQRAAAKAVC